MTKPASSSRTGRDLAGSPISAARPVEFPLGDMPQTDRVVLTSALHDAFLTLAGLTIVSSLTFWTLRKEDGESISPLSQTERAFCFAFSAANAIMFCLTAQAAVQSLYS